MRGNRFASVWLASVVLGLATAGEAAALQVLDQDGEPLPGLVLMVDGVPPASTGPYVMDQVSRRFVPRVLVVPSGSEVTFPNSDDVRHHVYSFSPAKTFELSLFSGTDAPPVTLNQAGVVVLGCNIHDSMIGYIVVTDSPRFAVSNGQGQLELPDLPAGQWPVSWWHPQLVDQPPQPLGELDLTQLQQLELPISYTPVADSQDDSPSLLRRYDPAGGKYGY